MPEQDNDKPLHEIEQWFRERQITLSYTEIVGDREPREWVALMLREGQDVGAGGVGVTKLAAAEDAQKRYGQEHGLGKEFAKSGSLTAGVTVGASSAGARGEAPQPTVKIEPMHLVHKRGLEEPTVSEIPPEVQEPLDQVAAEYGWRIGFANEPDGSIRWFVIDLEGETLLKSGIASSWDDARLAVIEDLHPPSGER